MRASLLLVAFLTALLAAGCMRHQPDDLSDRGLFTSNTVVSARDEQPKLQPPSVLQYVPPARQSAGSRTGAAYAYAPAAAEQAYTLGAGDKLRVVVFGQDGISNTYIVDAGGNVSLPLIGTLPARGLTTQQLAAAIAERLKQGYVREPHVTVEVETYRPFFILGEVTTPGQYPYVADMTVEKAIAIAGGFSPRAFKTTVELTRSAKGEQFKGDVPLNYPLRPGDTIMVKERWF
jgi:polysaccharide export outer membrane protein